MAAIGQKSGQSTIAQLQVREMSPMSRGMKPPTVFILVVLLLLSACGPATWLVNDTEKTVYVDFIGVDVPRAPFPQKVVSGDTMTAPLRPTELRTIYIGTNRHDLRSFNVADHCDLKKRICEIRASVLVKPD